MSDVNHFGSVSIIIHYTDNLPYSDLESLELSSISSLTL